MKLKFEYEIIDIGNEKTMVPLGYEGFNGVLHMNETTADIVAFLKEDTTEDKIVEGLLKMYDASEEDIRRSVRKVVEHLRSEGLLDE